jgi:hypothetical protein
VRDLALDAEIIAGTSPGLNHVLLQTTGRRTLHPAPHDD